MGNYDYLPVFGIATTISYLLRLKSTFEDLGITNSSFANTCGPLYCSVIIGSKEL